MYGSLQIHFCISVFLSFEIEIPMIIFVCNQADIIVTTSVKGGDCFCSACSRLNFKNEGACVRRVACRMVCLKKIFFWINVTPPFEINNQKRPPQSRFLHISNLCTFLTFYFRLPTASNLWSIILTQICCFLLLFFWWKFMLFCLALFSSLGCGREGAYFWAAEVGSRLFGGSCSHYDGSRSSKSRWWWQRCLGPVLHLTLAVSGMFCHNFWCFCQ